MKTFKKIVREKRLEKKMTQKALASKLGIAPKYFSDIETGRKHPSKKLIELISLELDIPLSKCFITSKNKSLKEKLDTEIQEKLEKIKTIEDQINRKKFEFEKLERTSGARSKITWLCIDIQKFTSEKFIEILSIYNLTKDSTRKSIYPAIKQLYFHLESINKNLKKLMDELEIIEEQDNKESKMEKENAFEKYNIPIPKRSIYDFEEQDQIKVLTFKIGHIVPRVLKDLDNFINKERQFTAKKTSLIFNGKNDKRENYKMTDYVSSYGSFFTEIETSITKALEDIIEEIIEDMIKYDKNPNRKNRFFNTLDSPVGIEFLFVIGMISIGEYLIRTYGGIKNGRYLQLVLEAKETLSKQIKEIFKDMNKGKYTKEQANRIFRSLIDEEIQHKIKIDVDMYDKVKFENDLYHICSEESIEKLIYEIVDHARVKATHQPRLLNLF